MITKITVAFVLWLILSCLLAYCLDVIEKKISHRRKARRTKAIYNALEREAKLRRQRTFLECYLYGIDVDTSKFKNSDYVIFSLRIKEN